MPAESLAPQQQRSRKTLDLLLTATLQTLEAEGLEACTIPAVAAGASVAPATIYRRFVDKDALLRAAFLHFLEQNHRAHENQGAKSLLRPTLEETAARTVHSLLQRYRTHPRLLRALAQYLESQAGSDFAADARRIIVDDLKRSAAALLEHRDRIRHPEPLRAVVFAVLSTVSSVEAFALGPASVWNAALPLPDKLFAAEQARALIAYLRRKP